MTPHDPLDRLPDDDATIASELDEIIERVVVDRRLIREARDRICDEATSICTLLDVEPQSDTGRRVFDCTQYKQVIAAIGPRIHELSFRRFHPNPKSEE